MEIKNKEITSKGIKITIEDNNQEVGRIYLYLIYNGLHQEPYGFLEDLFVDEKYRGQGIATKLIEKFIETAKEHNCYKLFANSRHSRPEVHRLYEKFGFKNRSIGFRLDF